MDEGAKARVGGVVLMYFEILVVHRLSYCDILFKPSQTLKFHQHHGVSPKGWRYDCLYGLQ